MKDERDFFTPEQVDQQVEQFSPDSPIIRLPRRGKAPLAEEHLMSDLQGYYQEERAQDLASLERAWQHVSLRLVSTQERSHLTDQSLPSHNLRSSHERTRMMRKHVSDTTQREKLWRGLNALAAVLVAALLVGGLITVLRLNHPQSATGAPHTAKVTPTPTTPPLALGTTIYTTSPDPQGYSNLSWSPNSTRLASVSSRGLQFWDATTGKNQVIFHFPDQYEHVWDMSWSPTGQNVAVGTNQEILIVNGQTGQAVRSLDTGAIYALAPGSTNSPYLDSKAPDGNGAGARALAWSPDGNSLAVAVSFGGSGSVQIWNIKTGTIASSFSLNGSYVPSSVGWSSDGKYLAMHAYNSRPTNTNTMPTNDDLVNVWNMTTHQVVFHQITTMLGSDAKVFWQPQTYNLAFLAIDPATNNVSFQIWNITNNTLLKQYSGGIGSDPMAWSPDGKEFAYSGEVGTGKSAVSAIIILDANSSQQIYAYKAPPASMLMQSQPLAWSPDGKYIVSTQGGGETITNGQVVGLPGVAKVWVA